MTLLFPQTFCLEDFFPSARLSPQPTAKMARSSALLTVLVITALALIAAGPLMRLFGDRVEAVVTRLLGVLLAALAAQYVIDGLRGSFGL